VFSRQLFYILPSEGLTKQKIDTKGIIEISNINVKYFFYSVDRKLKEKLKVVNIIIVC
jgi:hypothetical protein